MSKIKEWIDKFKKADKMAFIRKNDKVISIAMISFSGMLCLGMGIMLPLVPKDKTHETIFLQVMRNQVEKMKSNKIVLKDMESEVDQPISVDVRDYVDTSLLEVKVIKKLKLDTSLVNISEVGSYTYTIKYKDKTYNGIYVIKEKPLPKVDSITLKTVNLFIGDTLPKNIEYYIVEQLPDEVKAHIELDLSKVNMQAANSYPYTVTYDGTTYAGVVTVAEKLATETPAPIDPQTSGPQAVPGVPIT